SDTARAISSGRGLARTRFEGGGCNWSWVDDGYDDDELEKIADRLTYAKLGLSSHMCTGLHGVSASRATLDRLVPMIAAEMDRWQVMDPRSPDATDKTLGPLMVHKAQTALEVVAEARKAGLKIVREGGRAGGDYGSNSEAVKPALIDGVTPQTSLRHDWDGKGVREYKLATTELFMPILVAMALPRFEDFVKFSLFDNPHDLATSIWTRDDFKLTRARRRASARHPRLGAAARRRVHVHALVQIPPPARAVLLRRFLRPVPDADRRVAEPARLPRSRRGRHALRAPERTARGGERPVP